MEREHIGTLAGALEKAAMRYRYLDLFRGDPVPQSAAGLQGLIVMGGPMGVYESDTYPFLRQEQALIRQAIAERLPVLGICLGSQLIAAELGARVYPGPRKEIGWFPAEVENPNDLLTTALPHRFPAFHWHGDTFELPAGAARLFRSDLYENQGFRYGSNVYAIQFHFEVTAEMIAEWLQDGDCLQELTPLGEGTAEKIRQETSKWASGLATLSEKVFLRFFQNVLERAPAL